MTKLYALQVNGETVCEVYAEDSGLPIKPKLDRTWLRNLIARVLRERIYECDDRPKACPVSD